MKKVSIIIPVYNGEKYIGQTISTILKSTYNNLELIIMNDGSTDDSMSICKKYQEKDARIIIYTKDNEGVVAARNDGISMATGDYICFCDQDDIVAPETYERQIVSINEYKSDFCMCSTGRSIDGKNTIFECSEDANYAGNQILEELLYPLLFNGYKVPIRMSDNGRYPHIWNCMFQRQFIEKNNIKFRAYVNYEDDLLFKIEALSKAEKVSTIAYMGYFWRVNLKSETYAHKYVNNIGEKQQRCFNDMLECLKVRVSDKEVLDLFMQVTFCKQYLEAVHNLTSPYIKKKYSTIKNYYEKEIYARNYRFCVEAEKYIKRGRIRPRVLLMLMHKKLTLLSYFAEKTLDFIIRISLHSHTLTVIERKLKR